MEKKRSERRPPKNDLESLLIMAFIHFHLARERVVMTVRAARQLLTRRR